eukprot:8734317-Karenia_brevis.AAC.1
MPGREGRQGEFKDIPGPKRRGKAKVNAMTFWKLHLANMCIYVPRISPCDATMSPHSVQPPRAPTARLLHVTLDSVTLPHARV